MDSNDLKSLVNKYHAEMMKLVEEQKIMNKNQPTKEDRTKPPINPLSTQETIVNIVPDKNNASAAKITPSLSNTVHINRSPLAEDPPAVTTTPTTQNQQLPENNQKPVAAPPTSQTPKTPNVNQQPVATTPPSQPPQTPNINKQPIIITPPAQQQPVPKSFIDFMHDNPDYGFLKLQLYESEEALPVSYAEVTVSKMFDGYKHIFYIITSGISGTIEGIALPAPSKELFNNPSTANPNLSASYDIEVSHSKLKTEQDHLHTEIYDAVESIQLIQMVPK